MVQRITGKKVIGIKQTTKAIRNGEGTILYIAKDTDEELIEPIEILAKEHSLEIKYIDTMKELGKRCGIDVGAAVALIL